MEAKVHALPLFPLNVVLFPGQTLPLHIFEPRYRVMIKQCVDNNEPFGVVLAYEPDTPVEVGTTARITEVKRLPDGKMDITTVGEERFKIHNLRQSEHGYLIGDVTMQPFAGSPEKALVSHLTGLTRRYLKLLSDAMGLRFRFEHFPTDANDLALFTAIALRLPLDEKQAMLDQDTLPGLIESEVALLREENRQMSVAVAAIRPPEDQHGFCLN